MSFERRIFVCPIADVGAIRSRMANAKHPRHKYGYGDGNVSIRLSATGQEPATHMASDTMRDGDMRAQVEGMKGTHPSIVVYRTWAAIEAAGLKRIVPKSTIGGK